MKAMILAAGLGTRLLPYTLKRPKPLFPILNAPLLHLTVSRLRRAGFTEIVVNAHHLQPQIEEALRDETEIILQKEEKILGTGGGLRLALPNFGNDPVLVVNGDIYHTIDYRDVYNSHCNDRADVTLVLHDYPRFNDVAVHDACRVTGFSSSGTGFADPGNILAFTGIHVINPAVLYDIPPGESSCIIDCYRRLLQQGGTIKAYVAAGHFWTDMGTPVDYLQLHADLLQQKAALYEELLAAAGHGPFVVGKSAVMGRDVKLADWVCIGRGASIGKGAALQRTVVWDHAVVPAGADIEDAIITP